MRVLDKAVGPRVARFMSSPLVTVETSDTMRKTARTLLEHGISGALVLDHSGRPVGVISKTDFLRYERAYVAPTQAECRRLAVEHEPLEIVAQRASPTRERDEDYVLHWMKRGVVALPSESPIEEAAEIMATRRIHRVFVRERGVFVGVITAFDLLAAVGASGGRGTRTPRGRRPAPSTARRPRSRRVRTPR